MREKNRAIVGTTAGKLEGTIKNGLYIFKGIPYAAPPSGKLRWMPPQPPQSWSGIRPAKQYGAISPQNAMPDTGVEMGAPSFDDFIQSEDCLFLNVWTPGLDDEKRPVLFWIHGGAFIVGAGTEAFLDEGVLAKRGDVVVVSINYRLGALGFMNLNHLTGGKIPATGNEGLLDQIAALEWVQDNIAAFGGDPGNVTLSGFSAGAMSVGVLLSLPPARGKFHKAVIRSGAPNVVTPLQNSVETAERYLGLCGLKGSDVDAIRGLATQRLMEAQNELTARTAMEKNQITPFLPVVDGSLLTAFPMEVISKGDAGNIPVMAGSSLDELKVMTTMNPLSAKLDEDGLTGRLNQMIPENIVPGLAAAYRRGLAERGARVTPAEILGSVTADMMFRIPIVRLLEAQRDHGAPAYNYLFTYRSPVMGGALGAIHGLDNPFLFGALDPDFTGTDPELEDLAIKVQDSVVAFMRTGNPSCDTLGTWPPYGANRMTMILNRKTCIEEAPYEMERAAWDSYRYLFNPPM